MVADVDPRLEFATQCLLLAMGLGLHGGGDVCDHLQRLLELWRVSEATRGRFDEGFDPQPEAGQPLHRHDEQRPQIQSCVDGLVGWLVGMLVGR